jgi:hypothetical protein
MPALLTNPDILLQNNDLAAYIAVDGVVFGRFTGKSIANFFGPLAADGGQDEMIPSHDNIYFSRATVNGIVTA